MARIRGRQPIATANMRGTTMPKHEVRGPDPDGDWFVVQIDGDNETAIDETFATEEKAQAAADRLNP